MAGVKQPELPPGHAPPVVICQKTLVVSVQTEGFSKQIEKTIEGRGSNLKQLEKNPQDGFRLSISKNNIKRQGSSVSNCILCVVQFIREIVVGDQQHLEDKSVADSASQKSSGVSDTGKEPKGPNQVLKQQELRQAEILKIINESLHLLKTKKWADIKLQDKQIVLGLFSVIGGWYGFNRIAPGSKVLAHINNCWSEATVIDEGNAKRKVSVLLDEDQTLTVVKVAHSNIQPR